MNQYLSSKEQFWTLNQFFAKTWKIIVAIIVIGLMVFYGWNYWQTNQVEKSRKLSEYYEQLIAKLDKEKPDSVNELVNFAKSNNTIYSVFSDLYAAKFYVEVLNDYAGAQILLTDALTKTDVESIQAIINIRIARLQYQQEKYEESLTTLNHVTDEAWGPVVNEVRGDVYVKMARYADAVDAYNVALNSPIMIGLEANIKMKLNQAEYLKAKQFDEQGVNDTAVKEKAEQEVRLKNSETEDKTN
ncbi:hypothetical protein A9G34_09215 [Gilliamella sp. Choc4-2]|uniref:YfgM family protein n=1 Tax=unclassified Gilliamella TaxID=2685620 RepID=UPI0004DD4454|nr:tetratricopeptide repeat protein [Gilliamella apicola]KFA58044.1 hypothetical protein GAPWKB11_1930 [Gilliamella apicola]OCG31179.1 hypothetical protein A9G33_05865 [Gilliamella apicola]OCG43327.1 hypothetical protein A9G34_09215 [Gilliamella apicola]OCG55116.1 hypothetical protein A9G36_06440 [Gilliamella apicola]OCG63959.1 hypothetical protein A9G48_04675 [Gilliamella apicola]